MKNQERKWGVVEKEEEVHIVPGTPQPGAFFDMVLGKGVPISTNHWTDIPCWCGPAHEELENGRTLVTHRE